LERIQARTVAVLNPQETDPAGALARADKQKLKTGD
jgi:hypothetical protein